jgi:hypothetical protein
MVLDWWIENLFEGIFASFCSLRSFLERLDDARHAGDLIEEVELAVEERVCASVEALDYRGSWKSNMLRSYKFRNKNNIFILYHTLT